MLKLNRVYFFFIFIFLFDVANTQSISEETGKLYSEYIEARSQGEFITAESFLKEIELVIDSLPQYNAVVVYKNLGFVYWRLGHYKKSSAYYEAALRKKNSSDFINLKLESGLYNDMGILNMQIGDYNTALSYYESSVHIIKKMKNHDKEYFTQLARLQLNKGIVYYKLAKFNEATKYFSISAENKEEHSLPYLGSAYFNLARAYSAIDEFNLATKYYKESTQQWILEKGDTHFELANVYLEYAQFLAEQGEDIKSQEYFQKSIENYLSNYGPHHPYTASCYNIISDVHFSKSEYIQALEFAQVALGSICPGFVSDDFMSNPVGFESLLETRLLKIYTSKIDALVGLANSNENEYNISQRELLDFALETTEEAVTILTKIQDSYLSQESRLFLAEDQKNVFIQGIEVALMLSEITGELVYQEKAYKFASFGKALELNFEMRQKEQLYLNSLQDSSAIRLLEINENIESYSYLIQAEQNKSSPDSVKIAEWKQKRFDFRREFEQAHNSIFGADPIDGNISNQFTDFSLSQVKSRLINNQTVVEYSISGTEEDGSRKLFAFVIDKKEIFIYKTNLDSTYSVSVRTILDKLHGFDPYKSNDADRRQLDSALSTLCSLVFNPFESKINGNLVTIVPDEELSLIPFGAFNKAQLMDDHTSGQQSYLIRDYEFSYLPSSSLLRAPKRSRRRKTLDLIILSQDYMDQPGNGYSNLAAIEEETESILDLMKGTKVTTNQPKQDILQVIEGAYIVHFAMHNFPANETQSSSYMVLSTEVDSTMNHLLFDYEIDPLNLNASMVVLNACESGSGQLHPGEGVLSMTRSFMLAGAESAISTQWPVDDRAGSSIITDFYGGLAKGYTKSGALRKSQLNYLEHSTPSFSHPYYWAGYQVVGDPSSIRSNRKKLIPTIIILLLLVSVSGWRLSRKQRSGSLGKD